MGKVAADASIPEMLAEHDGEWLAIRVTARDESGRPLRGELLAHAQDDDTVYAAITGVSGAYIVYAGPPLPDGYGAIL